jgi:hypothetical protein
MFHPKALLDTQSISRLVGIKSGRENALDSMWSQAPTVSKKQLPALVQIISFQSLAEDRIATQLGANHKLLQFDVRHAFSSLS